MASPTAENENSNRFFHRLHGFFAFSSTNIATTLSKLGYFSSLFRSRSRWNCFPLPLSSTTLCRPSRVHRALDDIFQLVLKNLHIIQKDIEFWEYTARRSNCSKTRFMIFERGPRAFIHSLRGCPDQPAFLYINERLIFLTKFRKSLAIFLAKVHIEVNNIGEELANDTERKLPAVLGIMKDLFSELEESFGHIHENFKSNSSVDGTYFSPSLFDDMPEINQDGSQLTEPEIKDAIDWLYKSLHIVDCNISVLVSQYKKPRKFTKYWIHYSCGAVGLSICSIWLLRHSRLMGSSDIDNWIRDAKDSMFGFYTEHIEKPLLPVIAELFVTFRKKNKGMMEQEEVQLTSDIVHRAMLELDQMRCANKIHFAVLGLSLSGLLVMGLHAWFKQVNAWFKQDNFAWLRRRILLGEIKKNMMLCERFARLGEVNDAQYFFGLLLYKLNLLCHSVKGLAEASGEWQLLRQDIILMASPNLPTIQKVGVMEGLFEYDCLLTS